MVSVPTTKVLAIGRVTTKGALEARGPHMIAEVRATVRLHLGGKIDQRYIQTDGSGVVSMMSVTSTVEAYEFLEAHPLWQAGMIGFQHIPLGPLKPLALLLTPL